LKKPPKPSNILRNVQTPPIIEYLAQQAEDQGYLDYAQFVQVALYHPDHGYYTAKRQRVGKTKSADFYTSTTIGPLFGQLVIEAACTLLPSEDPEAYTFVEIAAEPGKSTLAGLPSPFGHSKVIRLGEPINVKGKAIVFANEWLDAQPFHRLIFTGGNWREIAIQIESGKLSETLLDQPSPETLPWLKELPCPHHEGYLLDIPTGAQKVLITLLLQKWEGLFLTLDYGKRLEALIHETPQGTARAYKNHHQSKELLAHPGKQDLTCHLCWEWLEDAMEKAGFEEIRLLRQESLFMRHSQETIRQTLENQQSPEVVGKIKELLHPAHLGHTFHALYGYRTKKH
jgi:SAM-dependent MidA family methyltransferase